jgi:hypothetical protein
VSANLFNLSKFQIMKNLVYAELVDGATTEMINDPKVFILSDGALFLVTTPEYATTHPDLTFFPIDEDSYNAYDLETLCEYL